MTRRAWNSETVSGWKQHMGMEYFHVLLYKSRPSFKESESRWLISVTNCWRCFLNKRGIKQTFSWTLEICSDYFSKHAAINTFTTSTITETATHYALFWTTERKRKNENTEMLLTWCSSLKLPLKTWYTIVSGSVRVQIPTQSASWHWLYLFSSERACHLWHRRFAIECVCCPLVCTSKPCPAASELSKQHLSAQSYQVHAQLVHSYTHTHGANSHTYPVADGNKLKWF